MICNSISLEINYSRAGLQHVGPKAMVKTYILDQDTANRGSKTRPLILICPGGGYDHLSTREAEPIALRMNSYGYHAAVLQYSLTPNRYPTQLLELAAAVRYLRLHSAEWFMDSERIIVMGFSAGAHLAGSLGTGWRDTILTEVLGGTSEDYKPYAQALCYPVVTSGEYAHRGSFHCLLGEDASEDALRKLSLELRVDEATVPAFVWHTFEDTSVPVENSLVLVQALRRYKIPCEMHLYERGKHGLALATAETDNLTGTCHEDECTTWPELFRTWLALHL